MKRNPFTKDLAEKEAKKYSARNEFAVKDKALYNFAQRHGILDSICSHMDGEFWKWTDEELIAEALNYNTKSEFKTGNGGAYASAAARGILNDITKHMIVLWEKKWTLESLKDESAKYSSIKEFRVLNWHAYVAAQKHGFLEEVCAHMLRLKNPNWSEEELKQEALKYKHRSEFSRKSSGAYNAALRFGIVDKICDHMTPLTNLSVRGLYAFEHPDKSVYVGLTWNYKERYAAHMLRNKILIEKFKIGGQKFITFNEFYPAKEAAKKESALIEKYRESGWTILNKAKPGALGGKRLYWTPEKIAEEAKKYTRKTDFQKHGKGAFNASRKFGIYEQVCSHMPKILGDGRTSK